MKDFGPHGGRILILEHVDGALAIRQRWWRKRLDTAQLRHGRRQLRLLGSRGRDGRKTRAPISTMSSHLA